MVIKILSVLGRTNFFPVLYFTPPWSYSPFGLKMTHLTKKGGEFGRTIAISRRLKVTDCEVFIGLWENTSGIVNGLLFGVLSPANII